MSRNPDISPAHGNICAVESERSDGGSREATGILGCGTNISCCVTPARRVWRARPCAPAGFRSHNEQTVSGQNRGLRRFLAVPEACYIAVDVTAVLVPGFASFSTEFVFLFCISRQFLHFRIISSDTENFLVSLKPTGDLILGCTPPEPQGKPAARYGSTFLAFSGLKINRFIHIDPRPLKHCGRRDMPYAQVLQSPM